jgi:hypothetical protein
MRDLRELDAYRLRGKASPHGWDGDETCGAFVIAAGSMKLAVIASSGEGWDHVSVSAANRCPSWLEMEHIKRMFFKDDEVAFQLHMPPRDHISLHPHCLHIWRPQGHSIPLPPPTMVA